MQLQDTQIPLFKTFRTKYPARNWSANQSVVEESYWTLERCIGEASHFPTRDEWEKKSPISYQKAIKRGWLTRCTFHIKDFKRKATVPAVWTLEGCIQVSQQCKTRAEFKNRFHYPYEKARLNGWLDVCCSHMG